MTKIKACFCIIILLGLIAYQSNAETAEINNNNGRLEFEERIEIECEQEFNVTSEELKSIENIHLTNEAKCFVKCLLEKGGTFQNGKIKDIEMVKDMEEDCESPLIFDKIKAEHLVKKCKKVKGSDDCDFALNYMVCILKDFGSHDGYCTIRN